MVNGTKRGPKQLGEIILDTANVNGISTEFLEKLIFSEHRQQHIKTGYFECWLRKRKLH